MAQGAEKPANVDLSGGPASPESGLATVGHFNHYALEEDDLSSQDQDLSIVLARGHSRRLQILQAIFARCDRKGDCLVWTGPHSGNGRGGGYGRISFGGVTSSVHRIVYETVYGPLPSKKQVDHTCNNRLCCKPEHLQQTTHKRNQKLRDKRRSEANK